MINAELNDAFDALAKRLTAKAARLAEARKRERELEQRKDPRRWRKPGLVWPLFGQG